MLDGDAGAGPKLVSSSAPFADGEAGVEVFLSGDKAGNAGLIVKVGRAGAGADNFDGYEVSLDARAKVLRLGRHQRDWRLLRDVPCDIAPDRWIALAVKMTESTIEVAVDGKRVLRYEDRERTLRSGTVGLRQWQRPARYRGLWVSTVGARVDLPFEAAPAEVVAVSGMWGPVSSGSAVLEARIEADTPTVYGMARLSWYLKRIQSPCSDWNDRRGRRGADDCGAARQFA